MKLVIFVFKFNVGKLNEPIQNFKYELKMKKVNNFNNVFYS